MRKVIRKLVVSGFKRYTVWSLTYGSASLQRDVFAFTVETRGNPGPIPYAEPLRNDVGILTGVPDSLIQKGWMNYWWDTHAYQQDARDILDELTKRNVKLSLGGSIHDPTDPVGRLLFNVLAMVTEFESDLIRLRTREGMKSSQGHGSATRQAAEPQAKHLLELHDLATTPKPNSPNSSASGDPRSTAPLTGCGQNPSNPQRPFAHHVPPSPNTQISTPRKSHTTE